MTTTKRKTILKTYVKKLEIKRLILRKKGHGARAENFARKLRIAQELMRP